MTETYLGRTVVPIEGVSIPVLSGVELLSKNYFEAERYAQKNSLIRLSSHDINTIYKAVKADKPTRKFMKYAVKNGLDETSAKEAYSSLHEDICGRYWIEAHGLLLWKQSSSFHPRIIDGKEMGDLESYLINEHKITDDDKIDISGCEQPVRIDWPKENGKISKKLAKMLNADNRTDVWTNSDINYNEGLRALGWSFWGREGPDVGSGWDPWSWDSDLGSLLGKPKK